MENYIEQSKCVDEMTMKSQYQMKNYDISIMKHLSKCYRYH